MDIREHRYEGRFVAVNRGKGLAELVQDSVKYENWFNAWEQNGDGRGLTYRAHEGQ